MEGFFRRVRRHDPSPRLAELAAGTPFAEGPTGELESLTEWILRRAKRLARCSPFLAAKLTKDYEEYIAGPTTGRLTPFINGRYWGGAKPREDQFGAFTAMQEAVEGLQADDSLFLAAWMFDPTLPLTNTNASGVNALGNKTWGELFQRKASDGVKIRILMSDFSALFKDQYAKLYNLFLPTLDKLIAKVPASLRDCLKYVVSLHPVQHSVVRWVGVHVATHHQKFMVLKTAKGTTAFCGGLDLAFMRTPAYWGKLEDTTYRWLWHDAHCRLEGMITNDLELEFVMRWNREKDHSVVASRPGWKSMETLLSSSPSAIDRSTDRNAHALQMLRTVSTPGTAPAIQNTRRDDIWQGYLRLIGCARSFLYLENQYFREPRLADAIVKQAKVRPELVVIVVVPSETDDLPDPGKKHGDALQHEFFLRLTKGIPARRLRVYTMFHRIIHSKVVLADDHALCIGSANANPRGFFLDSELNVTLDDDTAVAAFRVQLWAHNLGLSESTVAGWKASAFIARWNAVAAANDKRKTSPGKMTGEAIIHFDPLKEKGERQSIIDDVETEAPEARWQGEAETRARAHEGGTDA
jgi:phosphatidylserine/phosphatidylglycerophosphate/cardiolipin synthase-like enzyme